MITLTELTRSSASGRQARLAYEDLALVAHLSELERLQLDHAALAGRTPLSRGRFGSLAGLVRGVAARLRFSPKDKRAAMGQCC